MASNSPISHLARLLLFSLNSLACLAWEPGFTNPSCTELAPRPGQLRHPESPVVAITQNYSYSTDAEQNGKMISTLLRGNSCSNLLLDDDRFPFLLPLTPFHSSRSLLYFCLFRFLFISLLVFHLIVSRSSQKIAFKQRVHTLCNTQGNNTFPRILFQGILMAAFHISAFFQKS